MAKWVVGAKLSGRVQNCRVGSPLEVEMDQVGFYFEPEWEATVGKQEREWRTREVGGSDGGLAVMQRRERSGGRGDAANKREIGLGMTTEEDEKKKRLMVATGKKEEGEGREEVAQMEERSRLARVVGCVTPRERGGEGDCRQGRRHDGDARVAFYCGGGCGAL